ncbi:protein translocase subunit SecF [Paenibacillus sp. TRM 82003]|uniref:protein translocase subunit SecF n=1 Tax=Kineococcus sp. TRM81007 TaxID=2925831 RepID=UPI001F576348|nr:protein translocase subunit SecF [Kineococcus sp. TRM81007]MCI2238987.1 protein translocase subunit SecF [Kineococcus sp. TRM81007]MCI3924407.1 protein translocase subunit SecF [Paenibacillus sp. TRM 82003]
MGMAAVGNRLYTGESSFDFVGRRKLWFLIAAVCVALSAVLLVKPGLNFGIEFEGGSQFRVTGSSDQQAARQAVESVLPGTVPEVTQVGTDGVRVQTETVSTDELDRVRQELATVLGVPVEDVTSSAVGPSWGQDVTDKALTALVIFFVLVSVVMAVYFRTWTMALASMVALVHDLVITAGVYALVGFEVTPASVIGFLTILGYSLYDTVVVFDKVRENTDEAFVKRDRTFARAANLAVNQTVVRSVNTTVVALLPVAAILFIGDLLLGAGTLRDISLALFVGTIVGAYSSIFVATPLLVVLRSREPRVRALDAAVTERGARGETEPVGAASAGATAAGTTTDGTTGGTA